MLEKNRSAAAGSAPFQIIRPLGLKFRLMVLRPRRSIGGSVSFIALGMLLAP